MQKITTFLTFDHEAEQAVTFYTSIFARSRIGDITRYGDAGPGAIGSVMTIAFELDGQPFLALNGGPTFEFAQGISLMVSCETQAEVDQFWEKLSEGGEKGQCGWLTDRFGVSWQVAPSILLGKLVTDKDPAKVNRVMQAMMKMTKLDIAALKRAYEQ